MKYTSEITVSLSRDEVHKKLDNPENMKHWQEGLLGYKQFSEEPTKEGAQMELYYKIGKREMTLIETIIVNNFPYEFHATYDAKGVHNIQKNYFEVIDDCTTKWISESEFQFSGFMMKLMGFIMPGAFKKQSKKSLSDFKAFAEKGISVAK